MAVIEISNDLFFANIQSIINAGSSVELKVKGTSMHPTLLDGKHKVVLIPYQKQYLCIGIIALFIYRGRHILHRLVSIDESQLIFQGDNLPYVKESVREEDIIAIVEYIIEPGGKVVDCKKRSFFIKSRLWRPVHHNRLKLKEMIESVILKIFISMKP